MFEIGREYRRKIDIHQTYGGQAQGGISTPKNSSFIFIFTSDRGKQHGYKDEYRDGLFYYTGEGQIGDMAMDGGNKAILEHAKNGKVIHVFEYTKKAFVRYLGSAECLGHHQEIRPDREGNQRKAFVFHLDLNSAPNETIAFEQPPLYGIDNLKALQLKSIEELRNAALSASSSGFLPREKRAIALYRSSALKLYIAKRSNGKCEGCGSDAPFQTKTGPFLECHHVHRLADGGPDHPKNVAALCPNCHRRAHYAKDNVDFNNKLKMISLKVENEWLENFHNKEIFLQHP